ncbi:S-adenosyl-L-methionine-dependent methyltransferase [Aspergillus californicus]
MTAYITNHAPSVLQTHSWRTAQNSAPYLTPHIKPGMKILDIGCGPGSITVDFATLVPDGHVTGLEYSADPLPGARELAASKGITNIDFRTGDIHALDYEDDTFDIAHVHQVLQHISDPVKALSEMRRVVKPGGIVAARESASMTWYPENKGITSFLEIWEKLGTGKGGNPHPGRYMHVWVRDAGFELEKVQRGTGSWCFSSPAEREYWGGSMAKRTEASGWADLAIKEGVATKEELREIAEGWRAWVRDEEGWFGMLHGDMLCWK